ncbi:MAG TPA: DUF4404 family protein [Nevskiaceae bacterium]|nr:DUF4404 family protein [Nevskiaceae bacterium]
MTKDELRLTLEKLRAETQGLSFRDARDRERMQALLAAMERLLRRTDDAGEREEVLESIKQLEVQHPTLTAILSRLITALSSMGI